jgi:autotransporter-associated beta strand protein
VAFSQTFGSSFASDYTAIGMPQLATFNNQTVSGLAFSPTNSNQLIFDVTNAGTVSFYSVTITRGAGDHITGFATTPQQFASLSAGSGVTGSLIFAPNGTLLFTYQNNANIIGELAPGSSTLTANVTVPGISSNRVTGLALIPSGLTGAGQLLFSSFDSRSYYSGTLSPGANSTYNVTNTNSLITDSAHGPSGGIVYVPDGSPDFPDPSIIAADGTGLYTYDVNTSGYPILSSVQTFFTDQGEFNGAVIDPLTGDLLVTTNNGSGAYEIQGFNEPVTPTDFTASASGNWNDRTLWTPNGVPSGSNNIANLILPATGNNTINLGGATFTLNQLNFVGTGAGAWTLSNGTLVFAGTSPIVTNQSMTAGISAILGINIQLSADTTFETENPGVITEVTGSIGGSGKLIVSGAGTLLLTNSNTYGGGTMINAGTLQLGNGAAAGSISGDVVDNGVFAIDRSDSCSFAGIISGTGGVEQMGAGTTVLTGANTYQGDTLISKGTLEAANNQALGTGGVMVDSGGTLRVNSNFQVQIEGLSGTGIVMLQSNSALGIAVRAGMSSTFSGTLAGSGSNPLSLPVFVSNGPGTLGLDGTTTLSGIVGAFSGTLDLDSSGALSKNTFVTAASGSTVVVNGVNLTTAGLVNAGTGGSIVLNGGSLNVMLPAGVTTLENAFSGNISGSGGLTLNGAGITQILSGNNTYSGATVITAGTLLARSTTAFSSASVFTVNGTLDLGGFSNSILGLQGSGTVTNSGDTTPKPSVQISRAGNSLTGLEASLGNFAGNTPATRQRAILTVGAAGSTVQSVFSGRTPRRP